MPISRKTIAGLSALGAVLVAGPVAIAAQPPTQERARLALTVTGRDGSVDISTLRCGPDGGTHPAASQACSTLTLVNGDFGRLNSEPDMMCTLEYDPVTATATGYWDGQRVDYREVFPNRCAMWSYTGPVFNI
ncbi:MULTISPECIES: SSI family serine proteinase inhibitor [Actinokineospora]|uniref:Subtilase-type protease inhibitor n=1 Tax=Actinokineospora fastidiosa TaxID=1816 RepID=A0A918LDY9_9PSEU|nr:MULTISPECIES: SSI family serine proteinase inhibitor [Actinokineospora]UVS80197.1 Subtilisin inhibitor-like protein 5 [Actinokineospora sp. UTMC 2448]GGS33648.1 subtilase-type protease inhibitor [Actinokineospora fastidiosa]